MSKELQIKKVPFNPLKENCNLSLADVSPEAGNLNKKKVTDPTDNANERLIELTNEKNTEINTILSFLKNIENEKLEHSNKEIKRLLKGKIENALNFIKSYNFEFTKILEEIKNEIDASFIKGPVKEIKRIKEKCKLETDKNQNQNQNMKDVIRGTLTFPDLFKLIKSIPTIAKLLSENDCKIVYCKDTISDYTKYKKSGYREMKLFLEKDGVLYELQLHIEEFYYAKKTEDDLYSENRVFNEGEIIEEIKTHIKNYKNCYERANKDSSDAGCLTSLEQNKNNISKKIKLILRDYINKKISPEIYKIAEEKYRKKIRTFKPGYTDYNYDPSLITGELNNYLAKQKENRGQVLEEIEGLLENENWENYLKEGGDLETELNEYIKNLKDLTLGSFNAKNNNKK